MFSLTDVDHWLFIPLRQERPLARRLDVSLDFRSSPRDSLLLSRQRPAARMVTSETTTFLRDLSQHPGFVTEPREQLEQKLGLTP